MIYNHLLLVQLFIVIIIVVVLILLGRGWRSLHHDWPLDNDWIVINILLGGQRIFGFKIDDMNVENDGVTHKLLEDVVELGPRQDREDVDALNSNVHHKNDNAEGKSRLWMREFIWVKLYLLHHVDAVTYLTNTNHVQENICHELGDHDLEFTGRVLVNNFKLSRDDHFGEDYLEADEHQRLEVIHSHVSRPNLVLPLNSFCHIHKADVDEVSTVSPVTHFVLGGRLRSHKL